MIWIFDWVKQELIATYIKDKICISFLILIAVETIPMTSTMIWTTIVAQTVEQVTFATDSIDDGLSYPENNDVLRLSWKIMYWRLTCI